MAGFGIPISTPFSEHILQPELNDPAAASGRDLPRCRNRKAAVARIGDSRVWIAQIEMIEGIQAITAEMQPLLLSNPERLLQADIVVPEARSENAVALRVAPLPRRGRRERGGIEHCTPLTMSCPDCLPA